VVTIEKADIVELPDGQRKLGIWFKGKDKGLLLNKTNANTISGLYGDDTDTWLGKPVQLTTAYVDFQGKSVEAIRIIPKKPAPKSNAAPPPPQEDPGYDDGLSDEIPFECGASLQVEEWRPVFSAQGLEASSLGRVRAIPFEGRMPNGAKRIYKGKAWYGCWAEDAKRYILRHRGKTFKVARLVCEAFYGRAPFPGAVVMHMDENSRNNRADNLCWGTQKENLNAPGFLEYCRGRTGENSPTAKARRAAG
jgi:hypothetical protein